MSFLTAGYPTEIDGYQINTDFKLWLDYERDVANLNSNADFVLLIKKYYKEGQQLPFDPVKLIHNLSKFFYPYEKEQKKEGSAGTSARAYDFDVDAPLIYSAFMSQYGIDLSTAEMHWHRFLYLFNGLDEEHKISKIIQYRVMDLSQIKDKEQKKFYRKMKRLHKLPSLRKALTEKQVGDVFSEIF